MPSCRAVASQSVSGSPHRSFLPEHDAGASFRVFRRSGYSLTGAVKALRPTHGGKGAGVLFVVARRAGAVFGGRREPPVLRKDRSGHFERLSACLWVLGSLFRLPGRVENFYFREALKNAAPISEKRDVICNRERANPT